MAGSKAARIPNVWDTLRNQNNQINRDFALSRRVFNPQTIAIPPSPEIAPAGNSGSDSGNALQTAGGTMIGPIAYFPIPLFIQDLAIGKAASETSRVLEISGPIGAASSRILANGGVGTTDLEFIKGGQYAGQQLNIQGTLTQTLTIKNDPSSNGSEGLNIRTQTGSDITLVGNANVLLVFDVTSNQWAVISSIAGSATVLSLGQLSDVAITPDPPTADDILQFSTTSGLWENQPATAGGGLLTDLSNLAAGAIPPVDMSLNNFDLENVTDIRMNAAGTGVIDNIQHLDFFQVNHNIQSFGDRIDYQVDSPDFHDFLVGSTSAMSVAGHGINVIDVRFDTVDFVAPEEYQITQITDTLNFNTPTAKSFRWSISDVLQMSLSSGVVNANQFTATQSFFAAENAGFVAVNGRIGTLGGDVIIGSGGNSVNVTTLFDNLNSGQFADDSFNIFNAADPTKVAQFNAAPIGTGITRTYSLQNASGTLALLDGATQNFSVNVGFGNNSLQDVGGIFTTAGLSDIGQNTNYFDDLFINQIFFFGDPSLGYKIGGNITNGFDFVLPDATREFDFFFDGGTTPAWVIRPTAIDAQGNNVVDLATVQFRGNSAIIPGDVIRRIGYEGVNFLANVPTGGEFNLLFEGVSKWNFQITQLSGDNILLNNTLNFEDSSSDPAFAGQIVRNGGDLKVSTTEGIKNFKDIGSGGGGNEISQGNSFVRVSDVGTGAVNIEVDSVPIVSYTNTIGVVFEKTIQMNANPISTVGNITFANAFSVLNLNGSNISGVGKITSDAGKFNNDLEIDGTLNHDGSLVGFFGKSPTDQRTVAFMLGSETLGQTIAKINEMIGNLGNTGVGIGIWKHS